MVASDPVGVVCRGKRGRIDTSDPVPVHSTGKDRANMDLRDWEGKSVSFITPPGGVVIGEKTMGSSGKATGQEDEEVVIRWAKETNRMFERGPPVSHE